MQLVCVFFFRFTNNTHNNKYYNNKGNKWQPKSKPNQPQFTPSYNESNPKAIHQPQNENKINLFRDNDIVR